MGMFDERRRSWAVPWVSGLSHYSRRSWVDYFHGSLPLFISIEELCESIVHRLWCSEPPWHGTLAKVFFAEDYRLPLSSAISLPAPGGRSQRRQQERTLVKAYLLRRP